MMLFPGDAMVNGNGNKKKMDGFEAIQRLEQLLRDKLAEARAAVPPAAAPSEPVAAPPEDEPLPYGVSKVVYAMKRHDMERQKKKKR